MPRPPPRPGGPDVGVTPRAVVPMARGPGARSVPEAVSVAGARGTEREIH
ncbi:MAG: hypothetical protein LC769_13340 [Chloroflexi bacterium]|nr:hypothetical protein [Chloroflexota bacterium]